MPERISATPDREPDREVSGEYEREQEERSGAIAPESSQGQGRTGP